MTKKKLEESTAKQGEISGFGDYPVKLTDPTTKEVVAVVGYLQGERRIHFPQSVTFDQLESVGDFVQKDKFNKYISTERFDKAQEFADRKFSANLH